MAYKMLMNKGKFLKTEFGAELDSCIRAWDMYLTMHAQDVSDRATAKSLAMCQAQWEVYKLALKQFYSLDCHFTRTSEYYGVVILSDSGDEEFLIRYDYKKNDSDEKYYKVFEKKPLVVLVDHLQRNTKKTMNQLTLKVICFCL